MKTPTAEQIARAEALVKAKTKAEVIALAGNWRPLKAATAAGVRQRTRLIVDKETGELIPFDLWPAQEEALEVIEKPTS